MIEKQTCDECWSLKMYCPDCAKINIENEADAKMVFDIRSPDCLYIELNGKTFFIDDSTNDGICEVVR
jgi:hypothetical protein